jgi:hypothetical protein
MTKKLEYILVFGVILWGVFLANPFINVFSSSVTFGAMSSVADEMIWGFCYILIGFIGLGTVNFGDKCVRKVAMVMNAFAWSTLAIFYFLGNSHSTGFIPYTILAIISILAIYEVDYGN